ncbi:hypothetical protein Suden_1551 [Sulfurimonas denitrificans DSM 1251]|jgi:hypothetical protein|uniref:ATP/GTP-binding protein n=1 Tax=Sulfurimonas denitrificans (strain ATCC 33889 / DSM 1251) TaxID=326298 RepID=Q30QA3_SULDN|nr:hypothetical protein [Sulfurimonas denitrificans]ABB44828.1 hypothetical protein Suden_1551 [Sulfurimonas denitrificans DSM 1251]MDD3443632.1 hypothetical protein [Sulfurimonas denitrificans]
MNTSYSLNAYKSHDLNISMKTSSGDVIKMDFANESSFSMNSQKNSQGSKDELSFSSMQSFNYSIKSNGIDEQDKKEIEAFMKIAQPYIDSFLEELSAEAPSSPVTKLAHDIASIFEPNKARDENSKNYIKTNIVEMFDNSLQKLKLPQDSQTADANEMMEKIFENAKNLLEKTLQEFNEFNKKIYA